MREGHFVAEFQLLLSLGLHNYLLQLGNLLGVSYKAMRAYNTLWKLNYCGALRGRTVRVRKKLTFKDNFNEPLLSQVHYILFISVQINPG